MAERLAPLTVVAPITSRPEPPRRSRWRWPRRVLGSVVVIALVLAGTVATAHFLSIERHAFEIRATSLVPVGMPARVLVVVARPGQELPMAGTLAALDEAGTSVSLLALTGQVGGEGVGDGPAPASGEVPAPAEASAAGQAPAKRPAAGPASAQPSAAGGPSGRSATGAGAGRSAAGPAAVPSAATTAATPAQPAAAPAPARPSAAGVPGDVPVPVALDRAATSLGVDSVAVAGFVPGDLMLLDPGKVITRISAAIRAERPTAILTVSDATGADQDSQAVAGYTLVAAAEPRAGVARVWTVSRGAWERDWQALAGGTVDQKVPTPQVAVRLLGDIAGVKSAALVDYAENGDEQTVSARYPFWNAVSSTVYLRFWDREYFALAWGNPVE